MVHTAFGLSRPAGTWLDLPDLNTPRLSNLTHCFDLSGSLTTSSRERVLCTQNPFVSSFNASHKSVVQRQPKSVAANFSLLSMVFHMHSNRLVVDLPRKKTFYSFTSDGTLERLLVVQWLAFLRNLKAFLCRIQDKLYLLH